MAEMIADLFFDECENCYFQYDDEMRDAIDILSEFRIDRAAACAFAEAFAAKKLASQEEEIKQMREATCPCLTCKQHLAIIADGSKISEDGVITPKMPTDKDLPARRKRPWKTGG